MSLDIVIRNLPGSTNEQIASKVSDKSREDRNMEANLWNIAEAVGGDKLFVKGDIILKSDRNGGIRRYGDNNTGRGDGPLGRR